MQGTVNSTWSHTIQKSAILSRNACLLGELENGSQRIHIFSDGSSSDDSTSWAYVVLSEYDRGSFEYIGCCAGPVITNKEHPDFVGVVDANNYSAEICGMLWIWTLCISH